MTIADIRTCACRVLWSENRIVTEFFHSLTDGYGGLVVASTLVAEYLRLNYGINVPVSDIVLEADSYSNDAEIVDDYFTYAGKKMAVLDRQKVYQLPSKPSADCKVLTTTRIFAVDTIRNAAHHYGVSVTTFLCAVMVSAIMEIQKRDTSKEKRRKAVQVMIPVNLRKLFPSKTLRNFSLFALSCAKPQENGKNFDELIRITRNQLNAQNTKDYMASVMATYTKAERFLLYRVLPLPIKWVILRFAHQLYGESNSCISISNLGVVSLPEEMNELIEGIDFTLTPRISSPYNCGIVSFDGIISINFSRLCVEPEFEEVFFEKLKTQCSIKNRSKT